MEKEYENPNAGQGLKMLACVMSLFFIALIMSAEKEQRIIVQKPWIKVTVVARQDISIPCGLSSETEVHLVFSDGTTWSGSPSRTGGNPYPLLFVQKGQEVWYKDYYGPFTDRVWKVQ